MGEQNKFSVSIVFTPQLEQFSYDLELKTHKQNRNNKRTEIEEFDWFIKRIQMHVAFGWLSKCRVKKLHCRELSRNQSNYFALTSYCNPLQHDWLIEQRLLHIRVGKRRVYVLTLSPIG